MKDVFVHSHALVESQDIGPGTSIWAFAHVMKGAKIGENCNIGDHCFIERGAVIGKDVTIKNSNMIWEGVTLEDGVFVGPHVFFTNDLYPRSARHPLVNRRSDPSEWLVTTRVCHGAALGAAAVILGNITIGAFATVGAGALVTRDVPPHALVIGNPARIHGWMCLCGKPLPFDGDGTISCECDKLYRKQATQVAWLEESE